MGGLAILVNLLVFLLVAGLLVYLIRWACTYLEFPEPVVKVVPVIVVIVVLVALLRLVFGVGGAPVLLIQ